MGKKILLAFIAAVFITGMVIQAPHFRFQKPEPKSENSGDVVMANNQFALKYYSLLKNKEKGNLLFSPFSVSSTFVMVYEGARGGTAREIQSAFQFPEDENSRRMGYRGIFDSMKKTDKGYEIRIANALWLYKGYQLSEDFLKNVQDYYEGKVSELDFIKNPEGSRIEINNWVANSTNNKIRDLIPFGFIKTTTKFVLTNAIYFRGDWLVTFDKWGTTKRDFTTNDGTTVKVDMMSRTDKDAIFGYAENKDLQLLEAPYVGGSVSALFLLPKDKSITKLEDMLSPDNISTWRKSLKNQRVIVYIPKFKFETKYFMAKDLKDMGLSLAFSDMADFSGMAKDASRDLKIDEVVHQAFIELNEAGTEAAAATAVSMLNMMAAPNIYNDDKVPVFNADHPFIFLIQDKSTGNILFMGRVVNPKS